MKKIITNLFCGLSIALLLWLGLSYMDIVADNTHENPVHSQYNAFVIAFGGEEG